MGRPKKPKATKQDYIVAVRLSKKEKELVTNAASLVGEPVATIARELIIKWTKTIYKSKGLEI